MNSQEPFLSDNIEAVSMPNGVHVFELSLQGNQKWSKHRGVVRFPNRLRDCPTDIEFSNVVMDGFADLTINKITNECFWFQLINTSSKKKNWTTSISFDWEAKL